MRQSQRDKTDQLIAYHGDFTRFAAMMEAQDDEHREWVQHGRVAQEPKVPPELEHLRQSLLRRSGAIRPLFERQIGRIIQPGMFGVGRHDLWDLALVGHKEFYSGVFA